MTKADLVAHVASIIKLFTSEPTFLKMQQYEIRSSINKAILTKMLKQKSQLKLSLKFPIYKQWGYIPIITNHFPQ